MNLRTAGWIRGSMGGSSRGGDANLVFTQRCYNTPTQTVSIRTMFAQLCLQALSGLSPGSTNRTINAAEAVFALKTQARLVSRRIPDSVHEQPCSMGFRVCF